MSAETGTSAGPGGDTTGAPTSPSTTDPSTSATTTEPTTGDPSSTGPDPATTDGSSSSTGGPGIVTLQNDSWEDGQSAAFQGGFVQDECWASVYVPDPEHYPFEVRGVQMLVGGRDMGEETFSIGVWEVDEDNMPMTEIATGEAPISGEDANWDSVIVEALMIDPPMITAGNFAFVVCHINHTGSPSIANDTDGRTDDLNWIYLESGTWVQSAMFDVSGDWIMRANIEPI
jgi:hypothetical protein